MSFLPSSGLQPNDTSMPASAYLDFVAGVAIFDMNGLPQEYLTAIDDVDMGWVQTVFQVLGLQQLLTASLRLEGFGHATMCNADYCTVVVQQSEHYIALLVHQKDEVILQSLIGWVHTCNLDDLKQNPRFRRG